MCNTYILFSPLLPCQVYVEHPESFCVLTSLHVWPFCKTIVRRLFLSKKQIHHIFFFVFCFLSLLLSFPHTCVAFLCFCVRLHHESCVSFKHVRVCFMRVCLLFSSLIDCEIVKPEPQWFMVGLTDKKYNLIDSGDHFL